MSKTSAKRAADASTTAMNVDHSDDSSEATPKAGKETKKIDQGLKELTLRFEFQPRTSEAATKCAIVHTHLLLELQIAFDDDIKIYNNKNAELTKIDPIKWNSPAIHQRNFVMHARPGTQKRRTKYIILHRVHTNQSISTLRNYHTISKLLKSNDCWLKNHDWDESVWDTAQAGHLIGINPAHYTPSEATRKLSKQIEAKVNFKVPPIRLVYTSPRSNSSGGNEVRSKAYAVEFARADAAVVLRALKDTFTGTRQFLMAKLRFTHPIAYANALKLQNQHLASVYVLPLLNLTDDAIWYIEGKIKAVEGVTDIVPTRNSDTTGRFNILIKKSSFKAAKVIISTAFEQWYQEVPADVRPPPDAFSGSPRIGTQGSDDESTGEQSFLSMSALSFASMDMSTGPEPFESFTPASGTYSWSQVLQIPRQADPPIPIAVGLTTQVSDLTASQNTELESLKQQFNLLQTKAEEERRLDQEKISLLTKAFDRQEVMLTALQSLIQHIASQNKPATSLEIDADLPMTQAQPNEPEPRSTTTYVDTDMNDTDSAKRDNEQASDDSSAKRLDARPSPKKPDFPQHE
jgi:hypothetical protein